MLCSVSEYFATKFLTSWIFCMYSTLSLLSLYIWLLRKHLDILNKIILHERVGDSSPWSRVWKIFLHTFIEHYRADDDGKEFENLQKLEHRGDIKSLNTQQNTFNAEKRVTGAKEEEGTSCLLTSKMKNISQNREQHDKSFIFFYYEFGVNFKASNVTSTDDNGCNVHNVANTNHFPHSIGFYLTSTAKGYVHDYTCCQGGSPSYYIAVIIQNSLYLPVKLDRHNSTNEVCVLYHIRVHDDAKTSEGCVSMSCEHCSISSEGQYAKPLVWLDINYHKPHQKHRAQLKMEKVLLSANITVGRCGRIPSVSIPHCAVPVLASARCQCLRKLKQGIVNLKSYAMKATLHDLTLLHNTLLLLCGDVEINPGPTDLKLYTEISISDAPDVDDLISIPGIEKFWKEIGLRLGVSEAALEAIKKKHTKKLNRCKQLMFLKAVKRDDLTWKEVISVLFSLSLNRAVRNICKFMDFDYSYLLEKLSVSLSGASTSSIATTSTSAEELTSVIHDTLREDDSFEFTSEFEKRELLKSIGVVSSNLQVTLDRAEHVPITTIVDSDSSSVDSGLKTCSAMESMTMNNVESDEFVSAKSSLKDRSMNILYDSFETTINQSSGHQEEVDPTACVGSVPLGKNMEMQDFELRGESLNNWTNKKERDEAYIMAVNKWDLGAMKRILTEDSSLVDWRFKKNRTALMLAAIANQKEAIQLLLEFKASVKAVDVKGHTAHYLAAKYGNKKLMNILLKEDDAVDFNHSSAGISTDDISCMSRSHLESECKKLREAIKTNLQDAVEDILVAHTVIAELWETIDEERPLRALTRETMGNEVENMAELNARSETMELGNRSVPQEEIELSETFPWKDK